MEWKPILTCYHNKISIPQVRNLLNTMMVKYSIEKLDYLSQNKPALVTVIKIEKT